MKEADQLNPDERVLLLAPTGRDASMTSKFLAEGGMLAETCDGMRELCGKLSVGAGAALISEEALTPEAMRCLVQALAEQPQWSDFPLLILTGGGGVMPSNLGTLQALSEVSNMTLIERPTRVITLVSATRSALCARRRQYQVREHLAEEQRAREERSQLLEEAVAAQRQAEASRAQAEAANRAKDVFLATLSHELRTPLTAVLGWARMLRRLKMDEETVQHGIHIIERNAEAQNQLIQDLLDVSRIITGKLHLEVRPVELTPLIKAAVESVQQAAEAKSIELSVEFEGETCLVRGDPDRLQQVIWNLLSNAIKFTPKGGSVRVTLGREGSDARLMVRDTGQGISRDFLPHVFERFRQADGSTTRTHGGLGLGLAIVRHLVEQHGGSVSVESDGEQQGSTFYVNLPITAVNERALEQRVREEHASETQPLAASPLDGLRVLVVDDQADARELISMVLREAGAKAVTAASASDALESFKGAKPDVLISDIGMPGEDGFMLINRVRSLAPEEGGAVPAIALTAYATEEDRQRALAAGYDNHVSKPVEPGELIEAVAQAAASFK
jgi:signal transduction histidine kinase/ActR/RegA family two-component response regulator